MSGSANAGTTAERLTCGLEDLVYTFLRAPPKRVSAELRFLLTKTYMDVGNPETESDHLICHCDNVYSNLIGVRIAMNRIFPALVVFPCRQRLGCGSLEIF